MEPLSRPTGASSPMRGAALIAYLYLSYDDSAKYVREPLCPSDISPARGDASFAHLYLSCEDGAYFVD
jgi:hypothetical protein